MKKQVVSYYVYLITNLVLNKSYVGSKMCYKENPDNDGYMGSSTSLNMDYKIFGIENFKKQILKDDYKNIRDLLDGESNYILELNTLTPNGYNRQIPNQYPNFHNGGCKMSEEQKEKLRKVNKGQIPWNRGKKTGQIPWMKNRKMSEEHKLKIKKSNEGTPNINKGKKTGQIPWNKNKRKNPASTGFLNKLNII